MQAVLAHVTVAKPWHQRFTQARAALTDTQKGEWALVRDNRVIQAVRPAWVMLTHSDQEDERGGLRGPAAAGS